MRHIDFFKQPRPIQDRFIGATRGDVPAPLLTSGSRPLGPLYWWAAAVVTLALELGLVAVGYGALEHPWALQPTGVILLHCLLFGLAAFCTVRGFASNQRVRGLPYRPWVYLFPGSLVDARTHRFASYGISEYTAIDQQDAQLSITLEQGASYRFDAGTAARAREVKESLDEAQRLRNSPEGPQSMRSLGLLDPLADTGFSNPFSPHQPHSPPRGLPLWMAFATAIVVGGIVGGGVWKLRNAGSEARLFGAAAQLDTPQAYRDYLARGGVRSEVEAVLLPRSELRVIHDSSDIAAMERYEAKHPDSKIQTEVDAVHRKLLLSLLAKSRKAGTLSALKSFEASHARTDLVKGELAAAHRAVFVNAREQFLAKALPPEKSELVRYLLAALKYSQKAGPRVELRYRRRLAGRSDEIERAVMRHRFYASSSMLPTKYFSEKDARRREAGNSEALMAALQKSFSPEVLEFAVGEPLEEETELPNPKVPTVFIDRRVQLSGLFPSVKPRGIYVGMGVLYDVYLVLPGQRDADTMKFSTWKQPIRTVLDGEGKGPKDVYDATVGDSFGRFAEFFLDKLYREKPPKKG